MIATGMEYEVAGATEKHTRKLIGNAVQKSLKCFESCRAGAAHGYAKVRPLHYETRIISLCAGISGNRGSSNFSHENHSISNGPRTWCSWAH